ncbi:MAG: hypothetical protein ACXW2I_13895 [Burkholderiales bacterium]
MSAALVINVIVFQAGWLALVFGGAHGFASWSVLLPLLLRPATRFDGYPAAPAGARDALA